VIVDWSAVVVITRLLCLPCNTCACWTSHVVTFFSLLLPQLKLEVFNEHVTGLKKHVGVGTIVPASVWGYKNYESTVTIPLTYTKSKKDDKQRGVAIVTGKVVDDRSLLAECACTVS
jgi:hypothetical protein